MLKYVLIFTLFLSVSSSLNAQEDCRKQPLFISKWGFDVSKSALSSSEDKMMGPVLIEVENPEDHHSPRTRFFQDSSWLQVGYIGPIVVDDNGDVFTVPHPFVNALNTSFEDLNSIYRIDSRSGKMEKFLAIPVENIPHHRNPFGILGLSFDCTSGKLIVSTVSGSSDKEMLGKIVSVDTKSKKIKTIVEGLDAMGVYIATVTGERRLYYGKARKSEIWSVPLNEKNEAIGSHKMEVNFEGLGYRGDDKARKIILTDDKMLITGVPFYYNLTAPRVKQESTYVFKYNKLNQSWGLEMID